MAAHVGISFIPPEVHCAFGLLGPHTNPVSDQRPAGKGPNSQNEHSSTHEPTALVSRWFFGASQVIPDFALLGTLIRLPIYVLEIYNFASHLKTCLDESEEQKSQSHALRTLGSLARLIMMISCPVFLIQFDVLATVGNKIVPEFLSHFNEQQFCDHLSQAVRASARILNVNAQ
ncbi:MAG: hypothetical protein AAGF04_01775 [Chlamydiota bacterium]